MATRSIKIVRANLPTFTPSSIDVGLPVLGKNGLKALDTTLSTTPNEPMFDAIVGELKINPVESA